MYEMCVFFQILSGLIQFRIFQSDVVPQVFLVYFGNVLNVCILLNNNITISSELIKFCSLFSIRCRS